MRGACVVCEGCALAVVAGLAGCDKRTTGLFGMGKSRPAADVKSAVQAKPKAAPAPAPVCETRPEWWHDVPRKVGGVLSVCAGAEDRDLLTARRRAVENATQRFSAAAGGPPVEPQMQADSARLADGTFRAFVRMWAAAPPVR